jgi:hypothetical protein
MRIFDIRDNAKKEKIIMRMVEAHKLNLKDAYNNWKNFTQIASISQ